MKRERYSIIYSSKTGNTKKLAEAIYNTLPQNKCDYYGTVDKIDDVLSNVIYIGFWTEKGNADHLTIDFLNKLRIFSKMFTPALISPKSPIISLP